MTKKIFRSIFLTALAVLLVAFAVITAALYSHFADVQKQALRREASLAAAAVQTQGQSYLETLADAGERFTWIAADGTVLYDTAGESAKAENHADRAEFIDARKTAPGRAPVIQARCCKKQCTVPYALRTDLFCVSPSAAQRSAFCSSACCPHFCWCCSRR